MKKQTTSETPAPTTGLPESGREWYNQTIKSAANRLPAARARPKSDEERRDARAALLTHIVEQTAYLHLEELQDMAILLEILQNDTGCTSPAEEFITNLLASYQCDDLTPEDAERELAEFKSSFEITIRMAKRALATFGPALGIPQSWSEAS